MKNNFTKFDYIGQDILKQMVQFDSYHDNSINTYGWYDASGTTIHRGVSKNVLFELKCNDSSQLNFDTTIITKHDFDLLLANTPKDVEIMYMTILNKYTYVFNLRLVAADEDVFRVKTVQNRNTTMGNYRYFRDEEWVFIDRAKCKAKKYMTLIKKGGLNFNYNIDKLLKMG